MVSPRLIETDDFPFEFLSQLAQRESWRKEVHRPIYHIHKWWASRLGSVFRGILLGSILPPDGDLPQAFYATHSFSDKTVFDPFMGSGTTIGEAHKLGMIAFGNDINPVATESVRVALGPLDPDKLDQHFEVLSESVGARIKDLYRSTDRQGSPCDVLYYFWVMQATCQLCGAIVDLFNNWVIARNAYPARKPRVQVLCPSCGNIYPATVSDDNTKCPSCLFEFSVHSGVVSASKVSCPTCRAVFPLISAVKKNTKPPRFRLYGKLVLTDSGEKDYLPATPKDLAAYEKCSEQLAAEIRAGSIALPDLALEKGHNTSQAVNYGFRSWSDFFNDRQLLALSWLNAAIAEIPDRQARDSFLLLFSGILEFNNMFASYKGEGTGAIRHMFAHHILKPERTPIEGNPWGTDKSSGSFSTLYRTRLLRAAEYHRRPTEVNGPASGRGVVCSKPFSGHVVTHRPAHTSFSRRPIYLSCGDSSVTPIETATIDLVITDPPFFDNVHYSELADFFYAWQQLVPRGFIHERRSTRSDLEVQQSDARAFAEKLTLVLRECHRVLKDDGLLVLTYHHSREEGWAALTAALLASGFVVINAHPVKAEMSVAVPKSQAAEPIQLDIIIVCRKARSQPAATPKHQRALESARAKITRLQSAGFSLSRADRRLVLYGQLLTTARVPTDNAAIASLVRAEEDSSKCTRRQPSRSRPHAKTGRRPLPTVKTDTA